MSYEYTERLTNDLIPYINNSRLHSDEQVIQLASSIKEFGFTNPVLIDEQNGVIAGHGRIMAAKKLGIEQVPCIILAGLSEAQKKAYVIADNQIALNSSWDFDKLKLDAEFLKDRDFDLDLLGFDNGFFDDLLQDEEEIQQGLTDEDEAPEPPAEPVTKLGDVWLLGDHRLLCGDSTSIDAVEKLMNGEKADMCFTSPPCGVGSNGGNLRGCKTNPNGLYDNYDDDGGENWFELMTGFINNFIIHSDFLAINFQMLSGNKVESLKLFGYYAENTIDLAIWTKTNPQPAMAEMVMNSAFEFILLLTNDDSPKRTIKNSSFPRGSFSNVYSSPVASNKEFSKIHKATFPVEFAEHFISNLSKDNSLICEPFGGSGSTLIACEKTNRRCFMMELSPNYCDVIIKRWQDYTGNNAILESTNETYNQLSKE